MTYPPDFRSSSGPADGGLRASDADRERTAAALRRHHLDGRLDTDELQDRLGRCYAARTEGELHALVADLPGDRPVPRRASARAGAGGVPTIAVALLLAVAVAATVAAVQHGHPGPLPFLLVLLAVRLVRRPRGPRAYGGFRV
jgi:hypothetical protein